MRRHCFDEIKKKIAEANPNIEVLSEEYKNIKTKLKCRCIKHNHVFEIKAEQFLYRKVLGCYYCNREVGNFSNCKIPEVEISKTVEEKGYIYKGFEYKKGQCNAKFICPKHMDKGIQIKNFHDIRNGKCVCGICNRKEFTSEYLQKYLDEHFGTLEVLGEYKGGEQEIKCKCLVDGYEWITRPHNLFRGVWMS